MSIILWPQQRFLLYSSAISGIWMLKLYRHILLIFLLLFAYNALGQTRYALLIGVGNYPEGSGWNTIHGNNDVAVIKSALIRQGFSEGAMIELTDTSATKENMLKAFEKLAVRLQPEDVVYIHFSGHGQQITDLSGDEDDGYDEAWIPYDAKKQYEAGVYEGDNHLTDDELNAILTRLRIRVGSKGKIIVVADACHSGSGSRGLPDDTVFVRGTGEKFIIPLQASNVRKKPELTEWLFVAACKPYQTNYEYRSESGDYYGVLTYVIASDEKQFDNCKFTDLLQEWSDSVSEKSKYPQDLDNEGQPCRKSVYMF